MQRTEQTLLGENKKSVRCHVEVAGALKKNTPPFEATKSLEMTGVQGLRHNFNPFQGDGETLCLQQPAAGVMGQQEAENNMAIVITVDIYITVYSQVQLLREPRPVFRTCPVADWWLPPRA